MKKLQEADVKNKKVLLRVDFSVAVENGKIKEKLKIEAAKKTISYLLSQNAKMGLISHLGRPGGKFNQEFSFEPLTDGISKILNVRIIFIPDCVGEKIANSLDNLKNGEVILLENVRFYKEEEKNEIEFSKSLAENFDIFINDAFSVSHRNQSSVNGVAKFLPSCAGFQLQKEISEMEKIKNNFTRPAVAIIGGAKIETKLPVIKFFEKKYDYVLVGGKIANEALDQKIKFSQKVILPEDFIDDRLDIGLKTAKKFKEIISASKTIVWNGPLGKFEEERYAAGTYEILDAVLSAKEKNEAYVVIGGGETLEALGRKEATGKVSFVSTGGGAMLTYLGGGKMPGIEALLNG